MRRTVPESRTTDSGSWPEDLDRLTHLLLRAPEVAGRLRQARPDEEGPRSSGATFLRGEWWAADGARAPALVKLGAGEQEVHWAQRLARHAPDVIPTLYAAGHGLGDEPLPWLVMERCPLLMDYGWGDQLFTMLLDAGVRFQLATRRIGPPVGAADVAVERFCAQVRRGATSTPPAPGPAGELVEGLERTWRWVLSTCRVERCHGDLHPSNAVWRTAPPDPESRALLVDFIPQTLPWVSDAAYCQVLYWPAAPPAYPSYVHEMAALRRAYGLEVPGADDLDRLTRIFLGWYAMRIWPGATHRHGIPAYVAAVRRWVAECADA
ncbi:MAG TPA: phosphotransferase [Chloroflexota bacterium]|nr:phosphotransferase [Chloroflexota bacterium]